MDITLFNDLKNVAITPSQAEVLFSEVEPTLTEVEPLLSIVEP
jgi:hypothetical protein